MTERIITDSNGRKYITNEPLLHKPPPNKPWVGLTDEETAELVHRYAFYGLVEATESKLKEKNT